ncbi:MAG: tRNA 2-thiouridine(34) synthase MnmA [bacterium]|nr:tRNA 2-thiouridine(34) synthase MnmA [bacterium]
MRVILGLSGGVDSAVAAALLVERGCTVVGAYLKFDDGSATCPAKEDIAIARRVAAVLDIPFIVRDVSALYEREVLAPMRRGYTQGVTPNPDAACNRRVKFAELSALAAEHGADAVATGHYARIRRSARGRIELLRGADGEKDQSYFLWECTTRQLATVVFPIGCYAKPQVRAMARFRGLPNWDRPSTRGVCFLGTQDFSGYLATHEQPIPAAVVTTDGRHLGTVPMGQAYTIGQRVRIGGQPAPRYVVARDAVRQEITVTASPEDPARFTRVLTATHANWIGGMPPADGALFARIRHRQEPQPCTIRTTAHRVVVDFDRPQLAVAPGQAIVFNDGARIIGGAVIMA